MFEDTVGPFIIFPLADIIIYSKIYGYVYRSNDNGITAKAKNNVSCLDTIYVTKQLLTDREILLTNTPDTYFGDRLIKQIVCNYKRTCWLDENVKIEIFEMAKGWIQSYLINKKYKLSFKSKVIVRAILKNDFGAYGYLCKNIIF